MLLSQLQSSFLSSPSSFSSSPFNYPNHLKPYSCLPSSTGVVSRLLLPSKRKSNLTSTNALIINASAVQEPLSWFVRICLFYALSKIGMPGIEPKSPASDLESGDANVVDAGSGDLGFPKLVENEQVTSDKEAADKSKLVSKWRPTTKGTLKRNYRVLSKPEGQRVLRAVAALLSEDDHFTGAASHKGCQIRRESAHGESVCCNNVRALFDELPTPHVIVEITPFPAGPLTGNDYKKAEKLERVLRLGPSI